MPRMPQRKRPPTPRAKKTETIESLKESLAFCKAAINTAVDGIIIIDARGIIRDTNITAEHLFEFSREEMLGQNVCMLMPEPFRTQHDRFIAHFLKTGEKKIIGIGREVPGRTKSGRIFPLYLAVSDFEVNGKTFFVGVLRDLTDRKRLEGLMVAQSERERAEIGQDLHDVLAQQLTALTLMTRTLEKKLDRVASPLVAEAMELVQLSRAAMDEARRLSHGLFPTELANRGFFSALRELAENHAKLWGLEASFTHTGPEPQIPQAVSLHLYRIAQEAATNSRKHGQARRLEIATRLHSGQLFLRITDNGTGFDLAKYPPGMGLVIMKHRAEMVNASFTCSSQPGKGCVIECRLPLET
jgi:two-component system, LuxR family, sensor kinase FixL